ncbi:MAG: hypothetical protein Q8L61_06230, partial [Hyphomicrobium sp.]|nr:hypothetical protein [Hyphomicrobium sp.]
MQNPKHLNLLINVGAALVGVIVVGYVLYSALHTEAEAPCSERYQATRFSLQNAAGKPLTRAELQARAITYGTHVPLGQYTLPTATRSDRLTGVVTSPVPVFWNI